MKARGVGEWFCCKLAMRSGWEYDAAMDTSGRHFPKDVILTAVRWYLRYRLSLRDVQELMAERVTDVDYSTVNRWVVAYAPVLADAARKHKRCVGASWRLDETYIKVRGPWKYLYRAVDEDGDTVDFLLTAKRDAKAALRFLRHAVRNNGTPEKINIDKSGSNTAAFKAFKAFNKEMGTEIETRQCKYLNNVIEQDHRPSKNKMHQALGFKNFHGAHATLQGVEVLQMIRKGQVRPVPGGSFIEQFEALAA
jgi:transposase-like protein